MTVSKSLQDARELLDRLGIDHTPVVPYLAAEHKRAHDEAMLDFWLNSLVFWSTRPNNLPIDDLMIELAAGEISEFSQLLNSRTRYGGGWS